MAAGLFHRRNMFDGRGDNDFARSSSRAIMSRVLVLPIESDEGLMDTSPGAPLAAGEAEQLVK